MPIQVFRFDRFEVDTDRCVLRESGRRIPLRPKAIALLAYLIENRQHIASKEELLEAIWPQGTGTDANLTVGIAAVRRALGENSREHRFIATVPTVGYRFVAPVEPDPREQEVRSLVILPFQTPAVVPEHVGNGTAAALALSLSEGLGQTLRTLPGIRTRTVAHPTSTEDLSPKALSGLMRSEGVEAAILPRLSFDGRECEVRIELWQRSEESPRWSARLLHSIDELHALPLRIGHVLVNALRPETSDAFASRRWMPPSKNEKAFRLYLEGRFHFAGGIVPSKLQGAIDRFRDAIALDADFALAHATLVEALAYALWEGLDDTRVIAEEMRASATHALEIAPTLSETQRAAAVVALQLDRDGPRAREHLLAAVDYAPLDPMPYARYAQYLSATQEHDSALDAMRHALGLDPLSPRIHIVHAATLYYAGDLNSAQRRITEILQRDPDLDLGHVLQTWFEIGLGESATAIERAETLRVRFGETPFTEFYLGLARARAGDVSGAREILDLLKQRKERGEFVAAGHLALIHGGMGHLEVALEEMRRAADESWGYLVLLNADPVFDWVSRAPGGEELRHELLHLI